MGDTEGSSEQDDVSFLRTVSSKKLPMGYCLELVCRARSVIPIEPFEIFYSFKWHKIVFNLVTVSHKVNHYQTQAIGNYNKF